MRTVRDHDCQECGAVATVADEWFDGVEYRADYWCDECFYEED